MGTAPAHPPQQTPPATTNPNAPSRRFLRRYWPNLAARRGAVNQAPRGAVAADKCRCRSPPRPLPGPVPPPPGHGGLISSEWLFLPAQTICHCRGGGGGAERSEQRLNINLIGGIKGAGEGVSPLSVIKNKPAPPPSPPPPTPPTHTRPRTKPPPAAPGAGPPAPRCGAGGAEPPGVRGGKWGGVPQPDHPRPGPAANWVRSSC